MKVFFKKIFLAQIACGGGGGRVVGGVGGFNFFYRLISQADHQDKAPYKISTRYLKAFKSYPIVKFARGHPTSDIHPSIHPTPTLIEL